MGMFGGSFSNPFKKVADNLGGIISDNDPGIDLDPRTSDINIPDYGTPNLPTAPSFNIPDSTHPTSMLNQGLNFVAENVVGAVGEQLHAGGKIIDRNLNELAKLGMKAMTGTGGYSDEEPGDPPGPGPTGFEAANAQTTLLTRQRKRGEGRTAHAYSGSASQVGPR